MDEEHLQVELLLQRVLKEEARLTLEELDLLIAHKSICLPVFRGVLIEETLGLSDDSKELFYIPELMTSLLFSGFFEDGLAFEWIKKLLYLDPNRLEKVIGTDCYAGYLPYILAATAKERWVELKEVIDHLAQGTQTECVCLSALSTLYINGWIERGVFLSYLKSFLQKALEGTAYKRGFLEEVVYTCSDIWPGECLEEIKQVYALSLIDSKYITLDSVLEKYHEGLDACLEELRELRKIEPFFRKFLPLEGNISLSSKIDSLKENLSFEKLTALAQCANQYIKKTERNDPCPCFSGKKYKKCCLNKTDANRPPQFIPPSLITYEVTDEMLWGLEDISYISAEDKRKMLDIRACIKNDPQRSLQECKRYLLQYPQLPALYETLHLCYVELGDMQEGFKVLEELVRAFPDFLSGKFFYLTHLLERNEVEKVASILSSVMTLAQLYPHRKTFHVSEWSRFCYILGLYYTRVDKPDFAKAYLHLLETVEPNQVYIEGLKNLLHIKTFAFLYNRLSAQNRQSSLN